MNASIVLGTHMPDMVEIAKLKNVRVRVKYGSM